MGKIQVRVELPRKDRNFSQKLTFVNTSDNVGSGECYLLNKKLFLNTIEFQKRQYLLTLATGWRSVI